MSQVSGQTTSGLPANGAIETPATGVFSDPRVHEAVQVKNRVQWGPIVAGILTTIAVMLILTVLGIAVGASALKPREAGQALSNGAVIYGIISGIIAFFIGGWVAAKTAAVAGTGTGLINGLMVGFGVLALLIWLTSMGVGTIIGALGNNLGDIARLVQNNVSSQQAQQAAQSAQQQANQISPQQAFDTVKDAAWWTLAGIIIPLVAAALGGLVGHNNPTEVVQNR